MNISHNPMFVFFLLFVLFFLQVQGHFVMEKNSIKVLSPHEFRSKKIVALGSFGSEGYIIGRLVSPENSHGCQLFEGDKPFKFQSYHPTIVLLDRGECSFALKVYHAQMAGAAAVLITDVIDEPLENMGSPEERAEASRVSEKILIPSLLIQLSFGNSLKTSLNNKEKVLLRISPRINRNDLYYSAPSDIISISPPVKPKNQTPDNSKKGHEISMLHRWLIALASVAGILTIKIIGYIITLVVKKYLARLAQAAAAPTTVAPATTAPATIVAPATATPTTAINLPEVEIDIDV